MREKYAENLPKRLARVLEMIEAHLDDYGTMNREQYDDILRRLDVES
jgi:hypothetical protein